VVGEPQAEPAVSSCQVCWFSFAEPSSDVGAFHDDGLDLLAAERVAGAGGGFPQLRLGRYPLGFGLGHPAAYLLGIAAGVERGGLWRRK